MSSAPEDNRQQDERDRAGGDRSDFSILAGDAHEAFAAGLHLDLKYLGLSSMLTTSSVCPQQYLMGAWHMLREHQVHARVLVIVYSEDEMRTFLAGLGRKPDFSRDLFIEFFGIIGWMMPVVFIVVEGNLPLSPPQGVPVIDAVRVREVKVVNPNLRGNLEIIDQLYKSCEKYLIGRRDSDTRLRDLRGRIRAGIEGLAKLGGMAIMVFGPAKPSAGGQVSEDHALLWNLREEIRTSIEELGIRVYYGEDLDGVGHGELQAGLNPDLKEKLCSQSCELIIVIAGGFGAAAEIGALGQLENLARKMVIVVGEDKRTGFVRRGSIETAKSLGAQVVEYTNEALARGEVRGEVFDVIKPFLERALQRAIVKTSTPPE